jgi:cell division protein FtsA
VADVAFSGLCSALAVLTPEQKKSGAVLVDVGGGTTDYVAYADNVVAAAGSFEVGGDHVTNDIAQAFKIPVSQAENLKRQSGSAVIEAAGASQRVTLTPEDGFVGRSVSLRSLHAVVNARLDEILVMVRKALEKERLLHGIGAGVVLTGGVARQKGIVKLAERVLGVPCAVGKPRHVGGQATAIEGPEYAACVGMVQYGFKTALERAPSDGPVGWLKEKLFGR